MSQHMPTPSPNQVQVTRVPGTATAPTAAPRFPALAISKTRFILAFIVAVGSDAISIWTELVPPIQWVVDGVTALLLFALLGRRWQILPGLVAEAVPGLAVLPFWVLVVLTIFAMERKTLRAPSTSPTKQ
jgi:hypothetical protein